MELDIHQQLLLVTLFLSICLGAILNQTEFCTMGAISDWVNMGDTGRISSWFLAIIVATGGVIFFEQQELFSLIETRTPYRAPQFFWLRHLFGGLLFGIGMTLAGGCISKNLVRLGNGNLKSLIVLITALVAAWLMARGGLYALLFQSWISASMVDLSELGSGSQEIASLLPAFWGADSLFYNRIGLLILLVAGFVFFVFRSRDLFRRKRNIISGISIGLFVLAGWYLTGGAFGQEWQEEIVFMDRLPVGTGVQSYTFTGSLIDLTGFIVNDGQYQYITFGMIAMLGVIVGSFVSAFLRRTLNFEWFRTSRDFFNHLTGALLMGFGGVLALGCSIGQGITGVSTMSLGSWLALGGIMLGAAITMKFQFYRMVYEESSSFWSALISAMVDLRLLPGKFRKLEAIES